MNYKLLQEEIAKIAADQYYLGTWPSQIIIDIIEEAEELFSDEEEGYFPDRDTLKDFSYNLELIKEIYNPELNLDLDYLNRIINAFDKCVNDGK